MTKLIRGTDLNQQQQEEVKAAFIYRYTWENEKKITEYFGAEAIAAAKRGGFFRFDEEWIKEHAFFFRKDGTLASRPSYAEAFFLAEDVK